MKSLIRSKEKQIGKQEPEIARKTHELASLEKSFSQRPIDSKSNCLYKVSFAYKVYQQATGTMILRCWYTLNQYSDLAMKNIEAETDTT